MSKAVAPIAALALHKQGKFTLDEAIGKYLPEWKHPKVLVDGELVPVKNDITVDIMFENQLEEIGGKYVSGIAGLTENFRVVPPWPRAMRMRVIVNAEIPGTINE